MTKFKIMPFCALTCSCTCLAQCSPPGTQTQTTQTPSHNKIPQISNHDTIWPSNPYPPSSAKSWNPKYTTHKIPKTHNIR